MYYYFRFSKKISLNIYFLDNELYKDNFYYIEQVNNEIYKLSDNIKNYFNEIKLQMEISSNIELVNNLNNENNRLNEIFNKLYNDILKRQIEDPVVTSMGNKKLE